MQSLRAPQHLHLAAFHEQRRPIATNFAPFKTTGVAAAPSSSPLPRHLTTRVASTSDDELEIDLDAPQGQPLTADPSTSYIAADDDGDSRALAVAIGKVCWETKGEDLMVLHVAPLVYWTRYMVIATVFSRPQLNAMLAKVEKEALDTFGRRPSSPAQGTSAWELLDYGDVVVHVMTAQEREYYDLESFYGAAEEVNLPFVVEGENMAPSWETKL